MGLLDLSAFRQASFASEPFQFGVVPGFLKPEALRAAGADFPEIPHAGLFPLSELSGGPSFEALIEEIRSEEVAAAFSEKFGVDLSHRPLMITVRGRCQRKDGRIHTDTKAKVVTALLYLNEEWEADGGRLRFLRGPNDLDDAIAEAPPNGGTLVTFRRSERSYHGHKPYVGVRRYIMFNWMRDARVMGRELARHRRSAQVKRFVARFA